MWPWILFGGFVLFGNHHHHHAQLKTQEKSLDLKLEREWQKVEEENKAKFTYLLELERSCLTNEASLFCQLQSSLKSKKQTLIEIEDSIEEAEHKYYSVKREYNTALDKFCNSAKSLDFCQLRDSYISSKDNIDFIKEQIEFLAEDFYHFMGFRQGENNIPVSIEFENTEFEHIDSLEDEEEMYYDFIDALYIANDIVKVFILELNDFKKELRDYKNDPKEFNQLKKEAERALKRVDGINEYKQEIRSLSCNTVSICYVAILINKMHLDLLAQFYRENEEESRFHHLDLDDYFNDQSAQYLEFIEIDESFFSKDENLNNYNMLEPYYSNLGNQVFSDLLSEFGKELKFDRQFINNTFPDDDIMVDFFENFFHPEENDQNIESVMDRAVKVKKEYITVSLHYLPALNKLCKSTETPNFCQLREKGKSAIENLFEKFERYNLVYKEMEQEKYKYISVLKNPCEIDPLSVYCLVYSGNKKGRAYGQK